LSASFLWNLANLWWTLKCLLVFSNS